MSFDIRKTRRTFLRMSAAVGTGLILNGCKSIDKSQTKQSLAKQTLQKQYDNEKDGKVTAVEDLMREHGVIRRVLLAYTGIVARLSTNNFSDVTVNALRRTTRLFRVFGEEYHAKKLEEVYIFPVIKQTGGPAANYPDILIAQHRRGYEITDYILAVTQKQLDANNIDWLIRVLKSLVLMYRNHAAREDTVVFPAWKQALSVQQYNELSNRFEEIEQQTLGDEGFENAVRQIHDIEDSLSLSNLEQFTAIPPPQL